MRDCVEGTSRHVCIGDALKLTHHLIHPLPQSEGVSIVAGLQVLFAPAIFLPLPFVPAFLSESLCSLLFSRPRLPAFQELLSSQSSHLAPPFPFPIPIALARSMVPLNDSPSPLIVQVDDPGFYDDSSRQQASPYKNQKPPRIDTTLPLPTHLSNTVPAI